jgi:hypothetical protein
MNNGCYSERYNEGITRALEWSGVLTKGRYEYLRRIYPVGTHQVGG